MPKKELITSLRVDPALWRESKKAAIDCGLSVGEFVGVALKRYLEKLKEEEAEKR